LPEGDLISRLTDKKIRLVGYSLIGLGVLFYPSDSSDKLVKLEKQLKDAPNLPEQYDRRNKLISFLKSAHCSSRYLSEDVFSNLIQGATQMEDPMLHEYYLANLEKMLRLNNIFKDHRSELNLVQLLSISNELPFVSFGARAAFLKTLATHKHGAEMIFENKPILNFLNYSVIAGGVGHHDLRDRDLASTFALLSKHDQIIPTLSSDNFRKSIEILKRSPDSIAPSVIKNVEQRISDPKKNPPIELPARESASFKSYFLVSGVLAGLYATLYQSGFQRLNTKLYFNAFKSAAIPAIIGSQLLAFLVKVNLHQREMDPDDSPNDINTRIKIADFLTVAGFFAVNTFFPLAFLPTFLTTGAYMKCLRPKKVDIED